MVRCASGPIGFQDSLIINISGKNQLIPLSDHCHFIFLFYFVAPFIRLSRVPFSYDLSWLLFLFIALILFFCESGELRMENSMAFY